MNLLRIVGRALTDFLTLLLFLVVAPFWAIVHFLRGELGYERYRHIKSGRTYCLLRDEVVREHDLKPCVLYQCEEDDTMWVRPRDEFFDGRFEKI